MGILAPSPLTSLPFDCVFSCIREPIFQNVPTALTTSPSAQTSHSPKRIAVIGAGIVGVTTAYELAADGHRVTVFERRGSVAEEASFANAGVLAPGYVTPWAGPGMRTKVLANLWASHASVKLRLPLTAADLAWMWRWQRACKLETYVANRGRMRRLAFYSRERLQKLTADLGLEFDRADGYTVLLRTAKERQLVQASLAVLRDAGVSFQELDAASTRLIEPALNPDTAFEGSVHLPQDEVANCRQFAQLMRDQARHLGVEFAFKSQVTRIVQDSRGLFATLSIACEVTQVGQAGGTASGFSPAAANPAETGVVALNGVVQQRLESFDAVVVCAGADSAGLLAPLGLHLPLRPVYGYSISAQIREPLNAPRSGVMDERYKVAISRLGQRVRVAGSAELGGRLDKVNLGAVQTLYKVLQDWFPGAAAMRHVQEWKGARPMLPDGPPVLGASGLPGLWLNLGHGSSGWALSCGSARVTADVIQGRKPEIDLEGLSVERLGIKV